MIVTDLTFSRNFPANCKVIPLSMAGLKKLTSEKLSIDAALDNHLKLCDFRPAFGTVFSDLITGYDFWGYCDMDIIYGNIKHIVTDEMLDTYDVISARQEYLTGCFTLFRNDQRVSDLYQKSKDWQKVFQDPDYYNFDECNWKQVALVVHQKNIVEMDREIDCMTYIIKNEAATGNIKAHFVTVIKESVPGLLDWNKGNLVYNSGVAVLLYHLIEFKSLLFFYSPGWKAVPDRFFIESFYISRFSPQSASGRIFQYWVTKLKSADNFLKISKQFIKWGIKYLSSSRKIKNDHINFVNEIPGFYKGKGNENMFFDLIIQNGSLFVKFPHMPQPVLLRHRKNGSFLAGKFEIIQTVNIDVDLRYDKSEGICYLEILPYHIRNVLMVKQP